MKKRIWTLLLAAALSASMLAGCGGKAQPAVSESVEEPAQEPVAEQACAHEWVDATCAEAKHCSKCGETEGNALAHTWAEATFAAPKTCTQCGETEGERKQSYFEEHGVDVPDGPVLCTVDAVIYNPDEPEKFQKVVDSTWEQTDYYTEPAEEEGYQIVHLVVTPTIQLYYDAATGGDYHMCQTTTGIYDWYTGRELPSRDMVGDDTFEYGTSLEIDGVSYDVSYTKDMWGEWEGWVYDNAGNGTNDGKVIHSYVFKVPEGYDGLVFAAIPKHEYMELDTETVKSVDEARYASLDENEDRYIEGIQYFRINRSDDSAITSGANVASSAASGDTSDGAVIDDSRAQGSVGESGLPYYKIGYSPKDFTIGGLSIYDGKSLDEMYEAVDLQDAGISVGDAVVWLKENDELNEQVRFSLHQPEHLYGLAYYSNDVKEVEIFFTGIDGQSIETADFIQSPVIPGKTTFAEAVDALGIRDIVTAMGIEGDAFEDAILKFESQFGENSECRIIWHDDVRNLVVDWIDRDGRDIHLVLIGTGDVVDSLSISREN